MLGLWIVATPSQQIVVPKCKKFTHIFYSELPSEPTKTLKSVDSACPILRALSGIEKCLVVRCSVLQCVAVCYSVLQCVAVCCSVLQCVAVCCSVLQCAEVCAAECCIILQCVAQSNTATSVSVLQIMCVAVCCSVRSVLQCLAVSCSLLQQRVRVWKYRQIIWALHASRDHTDLNSENAPSHDHATSARDLEIALRHTRPVPLRSLISLTGNNHIVRLLCCSVLQCVAVCCSALQCVAVRCSVLQCATTDLQMYVPLRCSLTSIVQGDAVHCSVLQWIAACCSSSQRAAYCSVSILISSTSFLQRVAEYCSHCVYPDLLNM